MSCKDYEISCEPYQEMIALDAGGDLPATEVERLKRHLDSCAACRRFAGEMRDTQRSVALLADAPVDSEVLAAIRAGVLREVERDRRRPIPVRLPPRALALAAALIVALGALILLRANESGTTEQQPAEQPRVARTLPAAASQPVPPQPAAPPLIPEAVPAAPISETAGEEPAPRPPVTVSPETRLAERRPSVVPATSPAVTAAAAPPPGTPAAEPMIIKLVSEEADLVIYWLVQSPDEPIKETTNDEISAV